MGKSIIDVMTPNPRGVDTSSPITEAVRIMQTENVGSVPILEGDRLVGMLTDRDVAIRIVAEGKDPRATTAGEIASRNLVTIDQDQSLDEAERLMAKHQVRRLPVVEEDGRLIGILAQADIAQHDARHTGKVVQEISR